MIRCDECGREFTRHIAEDTTENIRSSASKHGWTYINGRDLCMNCSIEWEWTDIS